MSSVLDWSLSGEPQLQQQLQQQQQQQQGVGLSSCSTSSPGHEIQSHFTKDADAAFDDFCKKYLNSSNGFFMNHTINGKSMQCMNLNLMANRHSLFTDSSVIYNHNVLSNLIANGTEIKLNTKNAQNLKTGGTVNLPVKRLPDAVAAAASHARHSVQPEVILDQNQLKLKLQQQKQLLLQESKNNLIAKMAKLQLQQQQQSPNSAAMQEQRANHLLRASFENSLGHALNHSNHNLSVLSTSPNNSDSLSVKTGHDTRHTVLGVAATIALRPCMNSKNVRSPRKRSSLEHLLDSYEESIRVESKAQAAANSAAVNDGHLKVPVKIPINAASVGAMVDSADVSESTDSVNDIEAFLNTSIQQNVTNHCPHGLKAKIIPLNGNMVNFGSLNAKTIVHNHHQSVNNSVNLGKMIHNGSCTKVCCPLNESLMNNDAAVNNSPAHKMASVVNHSAHSHKQMPKTIGYSTANHFKKIKNRHSYFDYSTFQDDHEASDDDLSLNYQLYLNDYYQNHYNKLSGASKDCQAAAEIVMLGNEGVGPSKPTTSGHVSRSANFKFNSVNHHHLMGNGVAGHHNHYYNHANTTGQFHKHCHNPTSQDESFLNTSSASNEFLSDSTSNYEGLNKFESDQELNSSAQLLKQAPISIEEFNQAHCRNSIMTSTGCKSPRTTAPAAKPAHNFSLLQMVTDKTKQENEAAENLKKKAAAMNEFQPNLKKLIQIRKQQVVNIKVPKPNLTPAHQSHTSIGSATAKPVTTVYKPPTITTRTLKANLPIEIEPNSILHIPLKAACSIHVKSSSFDELKAQVPGIDSNDKITMDAHAKFQPKVELLKFTPQPSRAGETKREPLNEAKLATASVQGKSIELTMEEAASKQPQPGVGSYMQSASDHDHKQLQCHHAGHQIRTRHIHPANKVEKTEIKDVNKLKKQLLDYQKQVQLQNKLDEQIKYHRQQILQRQLANRLTEVPQMPRGGQAKESASALNWTCNQHASGHQPVQRDSSQQMNMAGARQNQPQSQQQQQQQQQNSNQNHDGGASANDPKVYDNKNIFYVNGSAYEKDSLYFEIPKKAKFSDEFSRRKCKTVTFGKINNSENDMDDDDNVVNTNIDMNSRASLTNINKLINLKHSCDLHNNPYMMRGGERTVRPKGWLGLKVVACGMNKDGRLPIPKANFFIDKGNFGDDAGFWSQNDAGDAMGIADGASGNCLLGYDPGDFSRTLMKLCSEFFVKENKISDAKSLLLRAYDMVQQKTCYGSSTACVVTLDHLNGLMTIANVGDSGYCLFRNGKIIRKSEPQRLTFDCPRQLDSYPWKEESIRAGVSYTDIIGSETPCETIKVMKDDIIIVSSDGLFDNLDVTEIEEICQKSKSVKDVVEKLVYNSIKFYRKPDDILVLIGKVVDNKPACVDHCYSRAHTTPAQQS